MKVIKKSVLKKLLLSLMIVFMLSNVIFTNNVQAISIKGGGLVEPVFQFVAWVGDVVLEFLQTKIGGGLPVEHLEGFNITYSPGNIFANKIALFDINFIKPNSYKVEYEGIGLETMKEGGWTLWDGNATRNGTLESQYGYSWDKPPVSIKIESKKGTFKTYEVYEWEYNGINYRLEGTVKYDDTYASVVVYDTNSDDEILSKMKQGEKYWKNGVFEER